MRRLFVCFVPLLLASCASVSYHLKVDDYDEFERVSVDNSKIVKSRSLWRGTVTNGSFSVLDYFVEFDRHDKNERRTDKRFKTKDECEYHVSSDLSYCGTLTRGGAPLYDIALRVSGEEDVRRSPSLILGCTDVVRKGFSESWLEIGGSEKIPFDTTKDLVLEDDSVVPIRAEMISDCVDDDGKQKYRRYRGKPIDNGSGILVRVRGEEFALLDFSESEFAESVPQILLRRNFPEELSQTERDRVFAVMILLCEMRYRFESWSAIERTIDKDYIESY